MKRTSAVLCLVVGLLALAFAFSSWSGPSPQPTVSPVDAAESVREQGDASGDMSGDEDPVPPVRTVGSGQPEPVCGVILKDAATIRPVVGARVQWQPRKSTDAQAWSAGVSNDSGQVLLGPGAWRIRVVDREWFAEPAALTLVDGWVTVWVVPRPELTLCVQDPDGLPVAGARADLLRFDGSERTLGRTNDRGRLVLGRIELDDRARLEVSHSLYQPAIAQASSLERRGGRVLVHLEPCRRILDVHTETVAGLPVGGVAVGIVHIEGGHGPIHLGETDASGRLRVGADWIGPRHLWVLGGGAYPARVGFSAPDGNSVRLVVFPRVSGRILLERPAPAPVLWRCSDVAMDAQGGGTMVREVVQARGSAKQPWELPAGREVCLQGFVGGELRYERRITVADHGWQMLAEESAHLPCRSLHLRAQGARIAAIREGEVDVHHADLPAHAVRVNVRTEATTIEVLLENGERHMLVGQPGDADLVVTLTARQVASVYIEAVDPDGDPLADVVLTLSCRAQFERVAAGWQAMRIGNVHRLRADAFGRTAGELPVGTYSVEVEPAAQRNPLAVAWDPIQPRKIELPASGIRARIVADAGRRVAVELQRQGRTPSAWRLVAGPWFGAFGGDRCQVWLPSSIRELEVQDLGGRSLGSAVVGPKQTRAVVELSAGGR
ncbi:MAG TPA: hypothetical protein ENI87_11680 [bacterium]|nr:hypothetical protein [bacterium]